MHYVRTLLDACAVVLNCMHAWGQCLMTVHYVCALASLYGWEPLAMAPTAVGVLVTRSSSLHGPVHSRRLLLVAGQGCVDK